MIKFVKVDEFITDIFDEVNTDFLGRLVADEAGVQIDISNNFSFGELLDLIEKLRQVADKFTEKS